METPTIESLMAAKRDEAKAALAEFNPKSAVAKHEANDFAVGIFSWSVSVEVDGTWTAGCGGTFDDALRSCREKLRKRPMLCPTCGGRTDGPCAHTH